MYRKKTKEAIIEKMYRKCIPKKLKKQLQKKCIETNVMKKLETKCTGNIQKKMYRRNVSEKNLKKTTIQKIYRIFI